MNIGVPKIKIKIRTKYICGQEIVQSEQKEKGTNKSVTYNRHAEGFFVARRLVVNTSAGGTKQFGFVRIKSERRKVAVQILQPLDKVVISVEGNLRTGLEIRVAQHASGQIDRRILEISNPQLLIETNQRLNEADVKVPGKLSVENILQHVVGNNPAFLMVVERTSDVPQILPKGFKLHNINSINSVGEECSKVFR